MKKNRSADKRGLGEEREMRNERFSLLLSLKPPSFPLTPDPFPILPSLFTLIPVILYIPRDCSFPLYESSLLRTLPVGLINQRMGRLL